MDLVALGMRIKAARENACLSREELAEKLGLRPIHIELLEKGDKPPRLETFINLANALHVSANDLLQDNIPFEAPKSEPVEQAFPEFVELLNCLTREDQWRVYCSLRSFAECTPAPLHSEI